MEAGWSAGCSNPDRRDHIPISLSAERHLVSGSADKSASILRSHSDGMGKGKLRSSRLDFDRGCLGDGVDDSYRSRHRSRRTPLVRLYKDVKLPRESNQAAFVEEMRRNSQDPDDAIVLAAYDAAHPDRGEVIRARGSGRLAGNWQTGAPFSRIAIPPPDGSLECARPFR
jgi:hypothetical protein